MSSSSTDGRRPQRSADKRRAILEGARSAFAREGYSRASIDTIAAEAGVSTRTLYNHFGDKASLFAKVIQTSATQVAEAQIEVIERHLGEVTDIEAALVAFARAWATPTPEFANHFSLVRQIQAEVGHLPRTVLEAWYEAGPRRVHRELTRRVAELAERGLLAVDDPERAASHLSALATAEVHNRSGHGIFPISGEEIATMSTAGVRTFLHGYLP